jgi:hypothetical protein
MKRTLGSLRSPLAIGHALLHPGRVVKEGLIRPIFKVDHIQELLYPGLDLSLR